MPDELDLPPAAPVEPHQHERHGRRWTDEYGWMRDHSDPRLSAYLRAEREYYDAAANSHGRLRGELFHEVELRLLPTDASVSRRHGSRFYYTRTVTGSDYEQFFQTCDPNVPGSCILDTAQHAGQDGFVEVGVREPSPDGRLLAYSVDTTGDEVYELRFRDTETLADLPERVGRSYYTGAWSSDSSTFFSIVHDDLFRPYQLWRHTIGTPVAEDALVWAEADARFEVTVGKSTDESWLIVTSESRTTTECHLIPADHPATAPILLRPRQDGIEYRIDAEADRIVAVTNDGAIEFQAVLLAGEQPAGDAIPPAHPGERLHACHALRDFWLLELRRDGFPLLRAVSRKTGSAVEIHAESPAAVVTLYALHGYAHQAVVVREESLVQPPAWYEIDLATGERRLLKRLEVPGYDASAYRTRRDHATAPRGGGENGRQWWMDGHLEAKTNTFDDHIAIADWLAGAGEGLPEPPGVQSVVDGRRIATRGPSAGGLLQGVAYSRRPYLRVEMGAGAHSGPAGRYAHFLYEAEVLAFALGFIL